DSLPGGQGAGEQRSAQSFVGFLGQALGEIGVSRHPAFLSLCKERACRKHVPIKHVAINKHVSAYSWPIRSDPAVNSARTMRAVRWPGGDDYRNLMSVRCLGPVCG